ncbi:hypothetical protein SAY86_029709 [Trapa natans]|uniref:VOC domain-containing protein n=1 Tax=Trapa natans TaxID=22666 RepID=A0AAN7LWT5_TRANT|nr:hypothetical protein SAY86_029709 [Trapa natans]
MGEKREINPKDNHISFQVYNGATIHNSSCSSFFFFPFARQNDSPTTLLASSMSLFAGILQCDSMQTVEKKLKEMEIKHVRSKVVEGGIEVDQLFFHDPDGFMIEICNCESLPVIPLAGEMALSCSLVNLHVLQPPIKQVTQP